MYGPAVWETWKTLFTNLCYTTSYKQKKINNTQSYSNYE